MKSIVLLSVLIMMSCKSKIQHQKIEVFNEKMNHFYQEKKLAELLDSPIDYLKFKETNKQVTTGIGERQSYLYGSNLGRIYYDYNFIIQKEDEINLIEIKVLKSSELAHIYDDPSELLIQIDANSLNSNLGELNIVNMPLDQIEELYGKAVRINFSSVYFKSNDKILLLHLKKGKIERFRYIWLNSNTDEISKVCNKFNDYISMRNSN